VRSKVRKIFAAAVIGGALAGGIAAPIAASTPAAMPYVYFHG